MVTPGGFSIDAGQAFEEAPPGFTLNATEYILRLACNGSLSKTVSVLETASSKCLQGGSIRHKLHQRTAIRYDKILGTVKALLCLRGYKLGTHTLRQTCGVPIGGPASMQLVENVFAVAVCLSVCLSVCLFV